jgi:hypothetical protein
VSGSHELFSCSYQQRTGAVQQQTWTHSHLSEQAAVGASVSEYHTVVVCMWLHINIAEYNCNSLAYDSPTYTSCPQVDPP